MSEFTEVLLEFGRLQYEAGRLAERLEKAYGMALTLRGLPDGPLEVVEGPRPMGRPLAGTGLNARYAKAIVEVVTAHAREMHVGEIRAGLPSPKPSEHNFNRAIEYAMEHCGLIRTARRGIYRVNGHPSAGDSTQAPRVET